MLCWSIFYRSSKDTKFKKMEFNFKSILTIPFGTFRNKTEVVGASGCVRTFVLRMLNLKQIGMHVY